MAAACPRRVPAPTPSSKAALSAFSESTSFRLAAKGVHMHVVYPAFMATELGLGALGRGLRRPPRLTTRSVDRVSRTILRRAGAGSLVISVSRPDRRGHGVRRRHAPHLPPPAPELVSAAAERSADDAGSLVGTGS